MRYPYGLGLLQPHVCYCTNNTATSSKTVAMHILINRAYLESEHPACYRIGHMHAWQCAYLSHNEGVQGAKGLLVDTLEPALVANLGLEDPQVAVGNQGLDQLVASTLVTVSCTVEMRA